MMGGMEAQKKFRNETKGTHFDGFWFDRPTGLDVPFQVDIQEFKHEVQFLVCVDNVQKPVKVQQTNLSLGYRDIHR